MIENVCARWLVSLLFLGVALVAVYRLTQRRGGRVEQITWLLHLAMAVAMTVMVWQPTPPVFGSSVLALAFLGAALVFVGIGVRTRQFRINGYHALMMMSMVWMYVAMSSGHDQAAGMSSASSAEEPAAMSHSMPDMAAMTTSPRSTGESTSVGSAWFAPAVNWTLVGFFAAATAFWLYRCYHGVARSGETQRRRRLLVEAGQLCQATMALGATIMFAAML